MADNKEGSSDQAKAWLILGVVFIALTWLMWSKFEFQIKDFFRLTRLAWMWPMSYILPADYSVMWNGQAMRFADWYRAIPNIPAQNLDNTTMGQISTLAMTPWRWVYTVIFVVMGLWVTFKGPLTHYRRKMDLNMLIKVQSENFPFIKPFVKFNPSNQPPRAPGAPVPAELPLFAEALGPEEWVAYTGVPVPDGKLDRDAAHREFAKQLGKPWRGPMHLQPHAQLLLAAFCLKAARKRTDADAMIGEIAACWTQEKGMKIPYRLISRARKILRDRDMIGPTMAKCNQHA